ncbi:thioredoxin family protein [Parapedobacter sp. DT-150]|uniref:thioredoxin family protein n=1 Tax=Parapedobacter sp. DT-150 TaxID=3396162 RepID=UPI003F1CAB96
MRRQYHPLLLSIILTLSAHTLASGQQGVDFFEGTWSEALQEAKSSGKLVFVDVYTDWCPPCKKMDKEVLPLPEVGQQYNEAFVNYKLDAEKGQGVALAGQYAVQAYPTYLYLDADGNLLHRAVGLLAPEAFLAQASQAKAFASGGEQLGELQAAFDEGKRDRQFLRTYIGKLSELRMDNGTALDAYFTGLSWDELKQPETWVFLGEHVNNANSATLVFLLENYSQLDDTIKRRLAPRLFSTLQDAAGQATVANDPLTAKQSYEFAAALLPYLGEQQQRAYRQYYMRYCIQLRDTARVKQLGMEMADGLMDIPMDSVRAEDVKRYREIMEPFWSGEQDSTKIEGFAEEQQSLRNLYSRELCSFLYEAANGYAAALAADDPALHEALAWATRCDALMPRNEPIQALVNKIQLRLRE